MRSLNEGDGNYIKSLMKSSWPTFDLTSVCEEAEFGRSRSPIRSHRAEKLHDECKYDADQTRLINVTQLHNEDDKFSH